MESAIFEITIVLLLLLANGVFAMSELAVMSARRARLQRRAEQGDTKARAALQLAEAPEDFLATVQVGITLVGIVAGAFGGAALAERLAVPLQQISWLAPYAERVAFGLVVLVITYLSLVIGELVPKRLALNHAESIARFMANPMRLLSRLCAPAVRLLSVSTEIILKLLNIKPSGEPHITEDELRILLRQGAQSGLFEHAEHEMVENIFHFGDQRVRALMTPRRDVVWLDSNNAPAEISRVVKASGYSRYLVCKGEIDRVQGMVRAKDLLQQQLEGQPLDLQAAVRQPLFVPESMAALKALEQFKKTGTHLAVVMDEYGGTLGIITHHDILEAIAGDITLIDEPEYKAITKREDGSYLLDGMLPVHEFKEALNLGKLPGEERGEFHTLGGFVLYKLGHIPNPADHFVYAGWRFEVVDMDQRRVDKVMVARVEKP